uniref:Uncharacterized protein n=1 Tax=Vitis vinifera TaxID=29760 RepID=A5AXQ6_VITVI|nr:hypothetical protein VITISV_026489 [Vitis vinifera]
MPQVSSLYLISSRPIPHWAFLQSAGGSKGLLMVDVDHIASAAIPLAAVTLHLPSYPRARASAVDLFEFLQLGKALEIKLHLSCSATKAFQVNTYQFPCRRC